MKKRSNPEMIDAENPELTEERFKRAKRFRTLPAALRAKLSDPHRVLIPAEDVKSLRELAGVSQGEFARVIGVSRRTLENWGQHRARPSGPAVRCSRSWRQIQGRRLRHFTDRATKNESSLSRA